MSKKKVTLSLDDKVYANFQKYCEENAIMLSKKIELFILEFLKNSSKNKKTSLFFIFFIGLLLMQISFVSANIIDRGSYWNKINNTDGTYSFEIYNSIVNYYNGTGYTPIVYGSCGGNCFRDWNGLIYRVSSNQKYVNLYSPDDNLISRFGFGITGDVGANSYKYTTLNFTWTWWEENNTATDEYIFKAWNNRADFNWTQEFHFYPNQSMKIKNRIANNLGALIQNTKFWYIQTVDVGDGIWFNGTRHTADTYKTGEFDSLLPKVKFEDDYVFDYSDLLVNGFNITDFYLGNGSIIGVSSIRILAIGITKNQGNFPNGFSVTIDPTVKISVEEGADSYVAGAGDANKNFGTSTILKTGDIARTYLLFNISAIPENQEIDNATLCLYVKTKKDQLINISHVYTDFSESTITWNNQPCGTEFDNSANCNLTTESSAQMNSSFEYTWRCWDIKNGVGKAYDDNDDNFKAVLYTADADINEFYSKEYSNSDLWPYLNVTYSETSSDTIPPYFTNLADQFIYDNESLSYDIDADDETAFGSFSINWTSIFSINSSSGLLTNTSGLSVGIYYINVTINDTSNNLNSSVIFVNVSASAVPDLTPPYFTTIPSSASINYGEGFGVDFDASDDVAFDSFSINWTTYFSINESGFLQNATQLAAGTYYINVSINDSSNNLNSSIYQVNVNQASQTAILNINESSPITYGTYINVSCNGELFRNYVDVTSEIAESVLLGVGSYNYSCQLAESQNYSYNDDNQTFVVNQALTNYSLTVYPLEYIFAAGEAKDEINSFEISLYDNTNSSVVVNIAYWIEQNDNFSFLSSPSSIILNSSDNITSPIKVNVSIQADSDIEDGTYNGNITLTIISLSITEIINLTYGINPPSGLPKIYSVNDEECSNDFPSLGCSYDQEIEQDSSFAADYKVVNNGSYNLTSCYIRNLIFWTTASISNFSLNISETREFSLTYSPTTSQLGVYYDQLYIDCLEGDSFGNRITSSPNNRPINRIEVNQKSSPPQPPQDNGGRRNDDGGAVITQNIKGLEIIQIPNLIVSLGETKQMVLGVKNTGTMFLNDCKVKGKGSNADWISSEGVRGLSAGEEHDFIFTLTVPLVLEAGEYNLSVGLDCVGYNKTISFIAEIIKKDLAVNLVSAEREKADELKLIYSLTELSGYEQNIEVEIVLFGYNNERAAELAETRIIGVGSKQEFETILTIPESLVGSFNLLINAVSDTGSAFMQEEIILGSSGVGGLAILDNAGTDTLFSIILAVIFIIFVILIARRILRLRGQKKQKSWNWDNKKERFEKARVEKVGGKRKGRKGKIEKVKKKSK